MSRERVPLAMRLSERFGNWAVRQLAREIEGSGLVQFRNIRLKRY